MRGRIDHVARAVEALASVPADVTPDQAIGVAQAAATLALVEQQRIANLITLARIAPTEHRSALFAPPDDLGGRSLRTEIREALGL